MAFAGDDVALEYRQFEDNLVSNAQRWKKYDVIMDQQFLFRIQGNNETKSISRQVRLAIDTEKREVFCFSKISREGNDSSQDEPKAKGKEAAVTKMMCRLVVAKDNEALIRGFPGPRRSVVDSKRPVYFFIADEQVPDLRSIGICKFPEPYHTSNLFDRRAEHVGTPPGAGEELVGTVSRNANQIGFVMNKKQSRSPVFWEKVYDAETLMPDSFEAKRKTDDNPRSIVEEIYFWQEFDGVYVPTSCVADENIYDANGNKTQAFFQSVDVMWLSFGEPLDQNLFDPKLHEDVSKLMKLLEPPEAN